MPPAAVADYGQRGAHRFEVREISAPGGDTLEVRGREPV